MNYAIELQDENSYSHFTEETNVQRRLSGHTASTCQSKNWALSLLTDALESSHCPVPAPGQGLCHLSVHSVVLSVFHYLPSKHCDTFLRIRSYVNPL